MISIIAIAFIAVRGIENITEYTKQEKNETIEHYKNIQISEYLQERINEIDIFILEQEKENKEADVLKVKYTYWYKNMEKEDFDNSKYYELFINNGKKNYDYYWLSSRCVYAGSGYANFDVYYVDSGGVSSNDLYYSDGGDDSDCNACRPVITLNSNIQIDTTNPGDGTENNAYNIK